MHQHPGIVNGKLIGRVRLLENGGMPKGAEAPKNQVGKRYTRRRLDDDV
jgi:hypothetical protein